MEISTDARLLIRVPSQINTQWLSTALGRSGLEVRDVERIGTGQMSLTFRVSLTDGGDAGTVVVKLASEDDTSRGAGVGMGAYFREVAFYQRLSGRIGGPIPRCHFAVYDEDEGWFTLLLDDVPGAAQGDQIAGCDVATAKTVMRTLARVHAPVFNDIGVGALDFLNLPNPVNSELMGALLPGFIDRYSDQLAEEHLEVCRRYVPAADAHAADRRPPLGLVHGDFRLDNLLFKDDDCVVVDWQVVQWGPAMIDAAYFLGGSLKVEDRRAHEEELVRIYHDGLLAEGVSNFSWEQCWEEYRRQVFWLLAMVIVPAMVVERTERGDEMFLTLFQRVCQQILDLGSLELLPEPGATPVARQPEAHDEGAHDPGREPFWNESWYFDAITKDGDTGVYVRLGRVPNQGHCVYSVAVVQASRPAVMVTDYTGPLPELAEHRQTVTADSYTAVHECLNPLQEYRIQFDGAAARYDDAADVLRAQQGTPVDLKLDLRWHTDDVPYAWRAGTRYEIPCRVEGTVTVDGVESTLSAPGQRDHSWGARDWWANDWMWSAFHFEDGTRVHAVTVPEVPGYAIGYVQRGGQVTELNTGTSSFDLAADGLVTVGTLELGEGDHRLVVEVRPQAFGPLRLTAPDGRVTHFVRAAAEFRATDGRSGVGWIEWNINQESVRG